VQDRYGSYTSDAQTDPTGPDTGSARVFRGGSFRGGSFDYYAQDTRSAFRMCALPGARSYGIGARLLRQGP